MDSLVWTFLWTSLAFYFLVVALATLFQDRLVYFPSKEIHQTPQMAGLEFEEIRFPSEDGTMLSAWFLPQKEPHYTLLFCHGNSGNISDRLESLKIFHSLGLQVFIFDFQGYGTSDGKRSSETKTHFDVLGAWNYLTEVKKINRETLILFGRSLGAAVALQLCKTQQPKALILESAFSSLPAVAQEVYPFFPSKWLSRFKYPNDKIIPSVSCPKLFIHSMHDELIEYHHSQTLFELASEPKKFSTITGSHNEGFLMSKRKYEEDIKRFLEDLQIETETPSTVQE